MRVMAKWMTGAVSAAVFAFACISGVHAQSQQFNDYDEPSAAALMRVKQERLLFTLAKGMRDLGTEASVYTLRLRYETSDGNILAPLVNPAVAEELDFIWNIFFTGSVPYLACTDTSQPIVGYVNPVIDSIVLAQWDITTRRPTQIEVMTGDRLRALANNAGHMAGEATIAPAWMRPSETIAGESSGARMIRVGTATLSGFQTLYPQTCDTPRALPTDDSTDYAQAMARLRLAHDSVAELKRMGPEYSPAHEAIIQLMNYGNVKPYEVISKIKVTDPVLLDLARLPPELRVVPVLNVPPTALGNDQDLSLIVHTYRATLGNYLISTTIRANDTIRMNTDTVVLPSQTLTPVFP